jgi:hypothetical protein
VTEPKNHHYIPQSYLRRFAYQKGDNYYVYVRYKGEKFYSVNVRNICSENYFYTNPDAEDKSEIESFYANNIDNIFPIIYELAKNNKIEKVDDETIERVVTAALSLYFRTPKFLNEYNAHILVLLKELEQFVMGKTEIHHVNFLGKKIDIKNLNLEILKNEILKENKVIFLSEHIQILNSLVKFIGADGLGFNIIADDSEFITSDNPVIIRNHLTGQFHNLFDPNNVIYLPIDPKTMLTITPKNFGKIENRVLRVLCTEDFTISTNFDIEANSEKWIIGSEDSLKNHLDDQAARKDETPENIQWLENNKIKANLMGELYDMLTQNNDEINSEIAAKVVSLSKNELLKDDPQLKKALESLKELGYNV